MTNSNDMEYKSFTILLQHAIGLKTQKQFAESCGMTPQYLNRLLKGNTRPTIKTLSEIAAHSESYVTLADLKVACGYSLETEESEKPYSPIIFDYGAVLRVACAECETKSYTSPEEFLGAITDKVKDYEERSAANVDSEFIGDARAESEDSPYKVQEADFIFSSPRSTARYKIVIRYMEYSRNGKSGIYRTRALIDLKDLRTYFPEVIDPSMEDDPDAVVDEYAPYREEMVKLPNDKGSAEAQLLASIFGEGNGKEIYVPTVEEGCGFYLDGVDEEAAINFCTKYTNFWPDKMSPITYKDEDRNEEGPFGMVAYIMRKLTGMVFLYYAESDEEFETSEGTMKSRPAIMMPEFYYEGKQPAFQKSTVLRVLGKTAADLGIRYYGTVWYMWMQPVRTEPEYTSEV